MNVADTEINEIVSKQEQDLIKDLGQLLERQNELLLGMSSTNYARLIAQEPNLNYGAGLCMVFWLEELLKMVSDAPAIKNIYSFKHKQRTTHLGRLIQVVGSRKALNFCLKKIPEHVREDLKSVWAEDGEWVKRRR